MSDLVTRAYAADIIHKDAKERMVYAIATGPRKDLDGQGCDPNWLREAVPTWMQRGNVRLMHNPTIPPVGKAKKAVETPDSEWAVAIKVVDDQAWKLIDEGLLTGVSIGAKNAVVVQHPDFPNGLIKGGDMVEMSFVDYPAYQYSKLADSAESLGLTFFKRAGNSVHYAGVVLEDDVPEAVAQLQKVAGAIEPPAEVRARLERQRQDAEAQSQAKLQGYGMMQNPYAGAPQMVVPGKTAPADLVKASDLKKKDYSGKERKAMADKGQAEEDGSFPIKTAGDVANAVKDFGRAGSKASDKSHIIARAKAIGATDKLPADWEGSTKKEKVALPADFKLAASREHGLVVKYDDGMAPMPMEEYLPEPKVNAEGDVELIGHEARHNPAINQVLRGLKQLVIQEMQEDYVEFDCIEDLADVARHFLAWVYGEQQEAESAAYQDAMSEMEGAAIALVAEPDRVKRHQMAKAIHTTLSKLSTLKEASMSEDVDKAKDGRDEAEEEEDDKGAEKVAKAKANDGDADDEPESKGEELDEEEEEEAPKKAAEADLEKEGRQISRATAERLLRLAETPGTPAGVAAGLRELAGFEALGETEPAGKNQLPAVRDGASAASGELQRERIDMENPFGEVMAAVSADFVTPTGKTAKPDVGKAFVNGVQKIAAEAAAAALEAFVTSDTFLTKIASGVQAQAEAVKAADAAKTATEAVVDVEKAVKGEIEKVRSEFNAELERIKQLPQPPKGAISEGLAAISKSFAANPEQAQPAVATPAASVGESIMKRALAGDPMAQRILREAVEGHAPSAIQEDAAKAAYKATVTRQAA